MKRNIADRSKTRSLLIAVTLGLGLLTALFQPGRAFASFSNADRQEQSAAVAAPPVEGAAAAPVAPSSAARAAAAQQRRMASKQRAMQARQAEMARRQAEEQHKARRRAFVGGVIVGILAARRR